MVGSNLREHARRAEWYRARRKDEKVIGLAIYPARRHVANFHLLGGAVDGDDFRTRPHIKIQPAFELVGTGDEQLVAIRDFAPKVVRQPAIGKAGGRAALEYHDASGFVEPAGSCGGTGSASDSSHDHQPDGLC